MTGEGDDDGDDDLESLRARVRTLEAELARERARIETIFANIPASFYVKDREGRYEYGSPHGFAMFGISLAEAIGRTDRELFPPELAERFMASDRRILGGHVVKADSYAIPTREGSRHFAGVRFPIPGPEGGAIGVCGFAVDVTDRVEMERELERFATTDAVTGLANRRKLDTHLDAELARAARSGEPLSLLLCDVDRFKRYNDRYGHARGDACLAEVARALAAVARRPADLAARYGGEEFVLVLPATTQEGAARLAARARAAVRELGLEHEENDGRGCVTTSIGVATVMGAWTRREVVELADRALYEAKAAGRDHQVVVAEEQPPASVGRGA